MICEQNEHNSNKLRILKRKQNTIIKVKKEFNKRFEQTEERISELEYRTIHIIQSEDQKEKRIKVNRASGISGISASGPSMHYGSPRRRRRKKK